MQYLTDCTQNVIPRLQITFQLLWIRHSDEYDKIKANSNILILRIFRFHLWHCNWVFAYRLKAPLEEWNPQVRWKNGSESSALIETSFMHSSLFPFWRRPFLFLRCLCRLWYTAADDKTYPAMTEFILITSGAVKRHLLHRLRREWKNMPAHPAFGYPHLATWLLDSQRQDGLLPCLTPIHPGIRGGFRSKTSWHRGGWNIPGLPFWRYASAPAEHYLGKQGQKGDCKFY